MDSVRYYAALVLLMTMPGGLMFWFSIHPFVHFWRKLGPRPTMAIHFLLISLLAGLMFLLRKPLLATEFGTEPWLIAPGLLLLALSVVLRVYVSRHLTTRILVGMPEIAPDQSPALLLTEGPFAHVRNPRYLQILVAILGWALICNYLAAYVVFAASIPILRVVIWMEEKELRGRFGKPYEEYCARVPRLLPKMRAEVSS